ncbi:MAG: hypothetical protein ACHQ53_16875, partial [Polyangiales bacterium]
MVVVRGGLLRSLGLPLLWVLSSSALPARAQSGLVLHALGKTTLRIDGDLRDWLGVHRIHVGQGSDSALDYALAYDDEALYVGARVLDDRFVRSTHPSPAEDALVLTLDMPRTSGHWQRTEVWLYAGVPGKQAALAVVGTDGAKPSPVKAVSVVEGPLEGERGYVLEARVPWSVVAGSGQRALGRGAIALHDVDRKGGPAVQLASSATGRELSPLLLGRGGNSAIAAFLRKKQLESGVRYDLMGDVSGDERLERVVLAGTYAVIAGPEIQGAGGDYGFL